MTFNKGCRALGVTSQRMISSIKPVGPQRQQGGKCLRLFGFLILIIPAVNIIKVSVNIKQYGLYKDVYEYSKKEDLNER